MWKNTYRSFIRPIRGQDQGDKTSQHHMLPPQHTIRVVLGLKRKGVGPMMC